MTHSGADLCQGRTVGMNVEKKFSEQAHQGCAGQAVQMGLRETILIVIERFRLGGLWRDFTPLRSRPVAIANVKVFAVETAGAGQTRAAYTNHG